MINAPENSVKIMATTPLNGSGWNTVFRHEVTDNRY